MACSLTKSGFDWNAAVNAKVTVKVVANSTTTLIAAEYNGIKLAVQNNATSFTVAQGPNLLLLALAGPKDTVEVVEDCGGGQTNHLFGYHDEPPHVLGFTIVGQ